MKETEIARGRELDALVAERVFGKVLLTQDGMAAEAERVWQRQPQCTYFFRFVCLGDSDDEYPKFEHREPRYSTDMAAAWEVVEKLKFDRGTFWFRLEYDNNEIWDATFQEVSGRKECFVGTAATAPHAICLAALKAVAP